MQHRTHANPFFLLSVKTITDEDRELLSDLPSNDRPPAEDGFDHLPRVTCSDRLRPCKSHPSGRTSLFCHKIWAECAKNNRKETEPPGAMYGDPKLLGNFSTTRFLITHSIHGFGGELHTRRFPDDGYFRVIAGRMSLIPKDRI
jgi:hypothetical protein